MLDEERRPIAPTVSNKERGDTFANRVGEFLKRQGHEVRPQYPVDVGLNAGHRKRHCFDFGNDQLLVECKYYDWTEAGNNPSAKVSTLNEAMMYFAGASSDCRKLLFISMTAKKGVRNPETLAEYYVRLHSHFIPERVEVWEFDDKKLTARQLQL